MQQVTSALLPVMLLTAVGVVAGRLRWIRPEAVKDLSNLVFLVLTPALLFRTMGGVQPGQVALAPVATYFGACLLIFLGTLAVRGWNRAAAVQGLAAVFSNNFMIGVPLVGLVWGEAGLAHLFPLISLHSLVLLTLATLALELAPGTAPTGLHPARAVLQAIRSAIWHPVPLPILAGLAWGQTGWAIPEVVDKPLQLLGQALGPVALLMVGVSLANTRLGPQWRGALVLALLKTAVHPLLVLGIGLALGLSGQAFAVMVLAACLPIGANVFLFSQRYGVVQDQVTAAVAVSTFTAVVSIAIALALLAPGR
ncbi:MULTISPECIES: AEC family transporter [Ramlibacter]|uniref:AEC family transporter n=1 Tax=Ramlibacter pinisoli TaxID=2682844 RepID=A0A6N8J0Y9_9BURK|nr:MULTISPECIES: AEC family transporter [Ramlibacter]MBA2961980.1 AEC family transporter [Ramlibacter sp. CGMCC 1.13660]MVQ31923.1 AEC family transporter [Ramlibacter pinisoli]